MVQAWERVTVMRGREERWQEAELYEQPLRAYLWARFTDWAWYKITAVAPWTLAEHDRKPFGWRLQFELWAGFERARRGRTVIARLPLPEEAESGHAGR
jgi:hypothetical protein